MPKARPQIRVAVLFSDGSMNVMGRRRVGGKSPLECATVECGDSNENTRRKADRARVVYVTVDMASIKNVFPD